MAYATTNRAETLEFSEENQFDEQEVNQEIDNFPEETLEQDVDEQEEDEDNDDDETSTVTKKTGRRKKSDDIEIKRVPNIGDALRAPYFAIKIVDSKEVKEDGVIKKEFECEVTWVRKPCTMEIGEIFTAKEIAFYSEYYKKVIVK